MSYSKERGQDMDNGLAAMEYISKTQKKKEAQSLQEMGEKLVKLPAGQLEDMALPVELNDAIRFAKAIKSHGARRRQMQLIGSLMRKIDSAPIQEALQHLEEGNYKKAAAFKETEMWRDELIAGNKGLIEDILNTCPDADRRQLTQLLRNAAKEREHNKPRGASRALFRYLEKIRNP